MGAAMGCRTISIWGRGHGTFEPPERIMPCERISLHPCVNYSRRESFPSVHMTECMNDTTANEVFQYYRSLKGGMSTDDRRIA
jgi:hypothetical protein